MNFSERFKKERGRWPNHKEYVGFSLWCQVQEGILTMDEALDRLLRVV